MNEAALHIWMTYLKGRFPKGQPRLEYRFGTPCDWVLKIRTNHAEHHLNAPSLIELMDIFNKHFDGYVDIPPDERPLNEPVSFQPKGYIAPITIPGPVYQHLKQMYAGEKLEGALKGYADHMRGISWS